MNKYIVESLGIFRQFHVVEAKNEKEAFEISKKADDNWQEYLGPVEVEVSEYSKEKVEELMSKSDYFFNGYSFLDSDGLVNYKFQED